MYFQEKTLFDRDLWVKVTQNVAQYPLHHVPYAATELVVARFNGLGGDTFTRNLTDGRTDARTDGWMMHRLWYEINIPFFYLTKMQVDQVINGKSQ